MTDLDKEIEAAASRAAHAETVFHESYGRYLSASDQFRRASQARDVAAAELLSLRVKRQRIEAMDEAITFCEAGI